MTKNMSFVHPTAKVSKSAEIGFFVYVGPNCVVGDFCIIENNCELRSDVIIDSNSILRSGCIIYSNCIIGQHVSIGHNTVLMSNTIVGDYSYIGALVNCEGDVIIGKYCGINAQCHLTKFMKIEDYVFFGPMVCTTNDRKIRYKRRGHGLNLKGPTIKSGVRIGNMSSILPDVVLERNSFVGACSIVTKDVEENTLVFGSPAKRKGEVSESDKI